MTSSTSGAGWGAYLARGARVEARGVTVLLKLFTDPNFGNCGLISAGDASVASLALGMELLDDACELKESDAAVDAFLSSFCMNPERFDSKRDSATDSGRTARMRATGLLANTLRSIACLSGDTCGITG